MHGVGKKFALKLYEAFGLKQPLVVNEQAEPDPAFPTVKYPNPEEGEEAFHLALETADSNNIPFVIANDPDADRLAIAEKVDGKWYIYHGNQIGILIADWLLTQWKINNPKGDISKVAMVNSAVSTKMLKRMAEVEVFIFIYRDLNMKKY